MSQHFRAARDLLFQHRDDYQAAYASFRWPVMDHFNWAIDWFDPLAASERANQTALWIVNEDGSEDKLTFAELSKRSAQIANSFRKLGIRRGDRVLTMLGNQTQLWESMLAAMKIGAVISPTSTLLTAADLLERIGRGQISHIISDEEFVEKFNDAPESCSRIVVGGLAKGWCSFEEGYGESAEFYPDGPTRPDDPLQLYFTSGTTSKPKMVLHTHQSYPVGHLSTMYWIGLQPGDLHCNVSSPGWAKHAWSSFFAQWNAEATIFALNHSRFNARALLNAVEKYEVTTFCAPPTVWRMLATERLTDFKLKLREVVSAGEPLNPEIIELVRTAWGLTIREGYGQTETSALIGNCPGQPVTPGLMGRPLPGYEVVVSKKDTAALEGELCVSLNPRPTGVMPGYQDEAGQLVPIEDDLYGTGDTVFMDDDGLFTFIGRSDDVFKSSDYRISPFELESALIEHPDIVECAIVPSPDAVRLAVPKAFIVTRADAIASRELALSIFRHVRRVLAPYKRVRRLEFSDLPKTTSGKIRRVELRQLEEANVREGERPANEFREDDFPEL